MDVQSPMPEKPEAVPRATVVAVPRATVGQDRHWLESTRDVTQIGFFVAIATVTVLTYRRAKATLLQPLRTEVFKEQLKAMSSVLELFVGKLETELRDDFDIPFLFEANALKMYDEYARTLFDFERQETVKRPYDREFCPSMHVTASYFEKNYKPSNTPIDDKTAEPREEKGLAREGRLAVWYKYEHGEIAIPRKLEESRAKLRKLVTSPLIPSDLVQKLKEFDGLISENISIVGQHLTSMAAEMTAHYPDLKSLNKFSLGWLSFPWLRKFKPLEPKAVEICKYIRDYCHTDQYLIDP